MKTITNDYKDAIKQFGRELDSRITYTVGSEIIELGPEDLNSVTPHYEGSLLKSVMKCLEIDSNEDIPLETVLSYDFGVKVDDEYEYINFGNYIVYSSEKQKDTGSYKIVCYDKMLYSMKEYENLNLTYPITINNYINAICTALGLTFKNYNTLFANYNKQIDHELYLDSEGNSLGYTFRDVLDELAEVTASTICINEQDDGLEIRYITNSGDTINEEYLKNINVNFGKKYGPINSIVLSRSEGADNVYLRDETSVTQNGLCEIKITDNQIMNFNDRSTYLADILAKLNGTEYYLNDFASTGITYYDLCDRYNIEIGEETYSCVMFNDEILVTQGLEENIHTNMPEQGETDYTKSDKTDQKINQTYLIVDKQNQTIESVVSNVTEQNNKISTIEQTVNELNSKISDIADITISGESYEATINLDNINTSEPIRVEIKPTSIQDFDCLYPYGGLYPSGTLYTKTRKIRFENTTTSEVFDYIIPYDLYYYNGDNYDSFVLDYDSQTCYVYKKVTLDANNNKVLLPTPLTISIPYPTINLTDGDYFISLLGYSDIYIFVRLMAQNIYTTQFATKAEMNSAITQKANEINATVALKLDEEDFTHASIVLKINDDTSQALIEADKINLTANDVINLLAGNTINLTSKNIAINSNNFKVTTNGNVTANNISCTNATINGTITKTTSLGTVTLGVGDAGLLELSATSSGHSYLGRYNVAGNSYYIDNKRIVHISATNEQILLNELNGNNQCTLQPYQLLFNNGGSSPSISIFGDTGEIYCTAVYQRSQEDLKKNIELYTNALKEVINTDIYKYNFKTEDNKHKKHIGFIIGESRKYSHDITSEDKNGHENGAEIYSMVSVLWQAVREQQDIIEKLNKRIELLEKEGEK